MDKFRAMQFFCRTVEAGSLAAAAAMLEVVPSAVSKTIAGLEQDLGFRLLNRSTRGFSLTDEGRAYHQQCRQILHQIEEAESHGRQGRARATGTLRVGMHPALRAPVLQSLGDFLDANPQLAIETTITNSPGAVIHDGLDVVLHVGQLPDSALVARPLGVTHAVACAAPEYLARHASPRHPLELATHRAVIYARRDEEPNLRWMFVQGEQRCAVDMAAAAVSRDGVGVVDAILGGGGIGRPFEISVRSWLRRGDLRALCCDWTSEAHPISAVLAAGAPSVKVRLYLEHVRRVLQAS